MRTGNAPITTMLILIPASPMIPNVSTRPDATTATERSGYRTWLKSAITATTIKIMAARMRIPIDEPIAICISCENAGSPDNVTEMPGGGFESDTTLRILFSTSSCRSLEIAGCRLMTLMVIMFEGRYRSTTSAGAWLMIWLTSAVEPGSEPPFPCFSRSTIPDTPSTYCWVAISDWSLSM
ncbi:MAG: hypothetical protein A4E42_00677 [Methanoregulaceae archaeon PtaU1.Bin222]|nr:MAG: hypothetical protein A4E42_00677 [Methanoregulaceae archaeon PtaU1.Bin222]